jgi:hypothetical protein
MMNMDKPFIYKIIQLVIMIGLSLTIISAQENSSSTFLNSTAKENASLNYTNQNISMMNNSVSNTTELDFRGNDAFIISSDMKPMPTDRVDINTSSNPFEIQPPKKAIFLIEGFAKPTRDEIYNDQYLLNAAYLSRNVEGTPHGYVTYYN